MSAMSSLARMAFRTGGNCCSTAVLRFFFMIPTTRLLMADASQPTTPSCTLTLIALRTPPWREEKGQVRTIRKRGAGARPRFRGRASRASGATDGPSLAARRLACSACACETRGRPLARLAAHRRGDGGLPCPCPSWGLVRQTFDSPHVRYFELRHEHIECAHVHDHHGRRLESGNGNA